MPAATSVVVWGNGSSGQTNLPPDLTNVVAISAGHWQCLALRADGTAVAWESLSGSGWGNIGSIAAGWHHDVFALNDGTVAVYYSMGPPAGLSNVVEIAAEIDYSWALKSDGTVTGWSTFSNGGIEPGPLATNLVTISGGGTFALGVKQDGMLLGWGKWFGWDLDAAAASTSNLVAVAAGTHHGLGVNRDGTATGWGSDWYGETQVPAGVSNAVAAAAGHDHSLLLRSDGTVLAWGGNDSGQATVPPGLTNVVAISAGGSFSMALVNDGSLFITEQPHHQRVFIGQSAYFRVLAMGRPQVSYQWQRNGTDLPGATNTILVIDNVQPGTNGTYSVIVTDGSGSLRSRDAELTVVASAPFVLLQPQPTNQSVVLGTNCAISAVVNGSLPIQLQWLLNGVPLAGATNVVLDLGSVQLSNAGSYQLVASNAFGSVSSSNAALSVYTSPPILGFQSPNQLVDPGSNVTLVVASTGSLPLAWQWRFNGSPLPGASQSALTLTNVTDADSGFYDTIVSNVTGVVTNSGLFLTVKTFRSALDATNLVWTTSTNLPWIVETNITHDGHAAAQSAALTASYQFSSLFATVAGPGTLSFWCRLDSGWGTEFLGFWIDGTQLFYLPRNTSGWQYKVVYLPAGSHDLEWSFYTPFNVDQRDRAWLDQVSYVAGPTVPTVTLAPTNQTVSAGANVGFSVAAVGTPVLAYQWQHDGNDIPDATNSSLSLTNVQASSAGSYSVSISNAYGVAEPSATLVVNPAAPFFAVQPRSQWRYVNGDVVFSAKALGTEPISYQWQFNGTNTNAPLLPSLSLNALQLSNAGAYRVVASNAVGSTVSSNANLRITPTVVAAWGSDPFPYGLTNIPLSLTNAIAISCGDYHGLALQGAGQIVSWGRNLYGLTNVPAGLTNVAAIAAGGTHNVALRREGAVAAWGYNPYGQTNVPAGLSNIVAIGAGHDHSLAVKADGTVVGWGYNADGGAATPPAGLGNVVAVAGGWAHSLALRRDGTVVAWGTSAYGVTNVPPGLSNVIAISAAAYNNLALCADGTVVAWGGSSYGQTNLPAGLSNVVAIACGATHSLALRSNGTVVAWGYSSSGQTNLPVDLTNAAVIATGGTFDLAIQNDGSPLLSRQLANRTVFSGTPVFMSVVAAGRGPLECAWAFNGTDMAGATNLWLDLPTLSPSGSGLYSISVRNQFGGPTSSTNLLSVIDQAPFLLLQPSNRVALAGGSMAFKVVADGSRPLTYQWQKDGAALPLSTDATLLLADLRRSNGGYYSVVVTNAFGAVTSAEARLRVVTPLRLSEPVLLPGQTLLFSAADADGGLLTTADLSFFQAWTSTNLVNWQPLPNALTFTNGLLWLRDAAASGAAHRFYRVSETAVSRVHVPQRLLAPSRQPDSAYLVGFGDSDGGRLTLSDLGNFQVWASTNLATWVKLSNSLTVSNGMVWAKDTNAGTLPRRFYRVLEK